VFELSLAIVAVLVGAVAQSATGFGLALISVPVLSVFVGPGSAVLIGLILPIPINIATLARSELPLDYSNLKLITITSCISLPFGVYLLRIVRPDMLNLLIGSMALALAVAALSPARIIVKQSRVSDTIVGLLSGIASATTGMGGPLLALVLAGRGYNKAVLRKAMSCYLIIINSVAIAMFLVLGRDFGTALHQLVVLIPSVVLGLWLGGLLFGVLSERSLSLAAIGLAAGAGIACILSSVLTR
jgi:uncharacterized membrane protein YfcA